MRAKWLLLLPLALASPGQAIVPPESASASPGDSVDLGPHIFYYEDASGQQKFSDIGGSGFRRNSKRVLNLGSSKSAYWLRVSINNPGRTREFLLEYGYGLIDDLTVYLPGPDGNYSSIKQGDHLPFSARKIAHRNFVLPITLPANRASTFYFRLQSGGALKAPLILHPPHRFTEKVNNENLLFGLFFGFFVVTALYNLFLAIALKSRSYLYYVIYILFGALSYFSLEGFSQQYIFPEHPLLCNLTTNTFIDLAILFAVLFTDRFLADRLHAPVLHRILQAAAIALFLAAIATAFLNYYASTLLMRLLVFSSCSLMLVAGVSAIMRKFKPARFYLAAWTALLLAIMLRVLVDNGQLPVTFITNNGLYIGSALEILFLSLALADRINLLQAEKLEAQKSIIQTKERMNRDLEERVRNRTRELAESNEEMRRIHRNIELELSMARQIQRQLIPITPPAIRGARLYSRYLSLETLGGDFIHYFHQEKECTGILLADASGHGVPAALVGSMSRMALDGMKTLSSEPGALLRALNQALLERVNNHFVTAFYAFFDPDSLALRYAVAGHPAPILLEKNSAQLVKGRGSILGQLSEPILYEATLTMKAGDRILLYSDGILDLLLPDGQRMGEGLLQKLALDLQKFRGDDFLDELLKKITEISLQDSFEDDVTLVLLELEHGT